MKLQFVSYDNIDIIKSNLPFWVDNFKSSSSEWLDKELGGNLLIDSKYTDVTDFELDMSKQSPFMTEAENAKRVYSSLRFLSDSQVLLIR